MSDEEDSSDGAPVEVPIDGVLDLHTFSPREVSDVVAEYLRECRSRGLLTVRLIHGKGTGALRRTVQVTLERHPDVQTFRTADEGAGGWGATLVELKPPDVRSGRVPPPRRSP